LGPLIGFFSVGILSKVSNTQVFRPFHPVLPFVSLGMEEKEGTLGNLGCLNDFSPEVL
jgi:hypothetical protein